MRKLNSPDEKTADSTLFLGTANLAAKRAAEEISTLADAPVPRPGQLIFH
jgi:hypothetical protein